MKQDTNRIRLRTLQIFLLPALVCLAACAGITNEARQDGREQELRAVLADADPLVRNLLGALNEGSYARYVKDADNASRIVAGEKAFTKFDESLKKHVGLYEEGMCQVNRIEQYAASYSIYYFVKFQKVDYQQPVTVVLRVKKAGGGLKILEVSYRHARLETQ